MAANEPTRTRSHVLEESSRLHVKTVFNNFGWVAHDLNPDYGEDLFVFVYDGSIATGDLFFVQIKSTESVSTEPVYRLRVASVRRWSRLSVPVVLVHYASVPTVRSYWSAFNAKDWSHLLASVAEGQETVCVPQDPSRILDDTSAAQLKFSVRLPPRAVDLAPLRSLLREVEAQSGEIQDWLLLYQHEYDEFSGATTEAETRAMFEQGGWGTKGSKGQDIHDSLSPHHHMGAVEWGEMCQVLSKRLDRLPKTVPAGIINNAEAFSDLILGLQQRILTRNESPPATETVHRLAELELSGNELSSSLAALSGVDPARWEVAELLRKCALVSACIDGIKWSALDLLIG